MARKTKATETCASHDPVVKSDAPVVLAYKGFDANMQCRGFQFEIGKTYTHEGTVEACSSGFHACENPFEVWNYYPLNGSNKFCSVELSGAISRHEEDSKIAAATISIKAEIGLPTIIADAVKFVMSLVKASDTTTATTGDRANAATTGDWANAATTGDRANAATTGDRANAATTGNWASAATTGYWANAATTGNWSSAATTGNWAKAATTGDRANAATTGDRANAATTGEHAISAALGIEGKAKAGIGGAIVLCCRNHNGELISIRAGKVGENGIKPDVWYSLDKSGEFVEVEA